MFEIKDMKSQVSAQHMTAVPFALEACHSNAQPASPESTVTVALKFSRASRDSRPVIRGPTGRRWLLLLYQSASESSSRR